MACLFFDPLPPCVTSRNGRAVFLIVAVVAAQITLNLNVPAMELRMIVVSWLPLVPAVLAPLREVHIHEEAATIIWVVRIEELIHILLLIICPVGVVRASNEVEDASVPPSVVTSALAPWG